MKKSTLSILRCPEIGQPLALETSSEDAEVILEGQLVSPNGRSYPIRDGVPNLVFPDELMPSDEEFLQQYEEQANQYDTMVRFLFESFFEDEEANRAQMAAMLEVEPGDRVLEVSCGTGSNLFPLWDQVRPEGELFALDLSPGMMGVARQKMDAAQIPVEFFLGNGAYLPFDDGEFDGLFHIGGLNTFGEVKKALAEMARVVKVGGKVLVVDEGLAPWLPETEYGQMLLNTNKLYEHQPPLFALPANAREVRLDWVMGNAFYLITFRVGETEPQLNLELEIPGQGQTIGEMIQGAGE